MHCKSDNKIVIILILINLLIKGFFLSHNSLNNDEAFSVYHAQMNIFDIITQLSKGNNPPLFEILLHAWTKVFGISEFSVRMPSLIFSSISVFYIFKLAFKYLNKRIAIYASIIFIFSNYHIMLAHEARTYTLLGMFSIMSMYYFIEIINKHISPSTQDRKKHNMQLTLLLIINSLIIYTHYFGFFILILQLIFLAYKKDVFLKYWRGILIAIGIVFFLYTPNIMVLTNRFMDSATNGTWVDTPKGFESLYEMLRSFSNAPVLTVFLICFFLAALIKYIRNLKPHSPNPYYRFIIFWFVFIFFFMFISSYAIPMFIDRYLMPAAIAFPLVIAISTEYLIQGKKSKYIIPIIVCLLFIITSKPNITNNRNVEEVVNTVNATQKENTLILICPQDFILNFTYYYNLDVFKNHTTDNIYSHIQNKLQSSNIYGTNNIKEIDFKNWSHILFVDAAANFSYPNNNIKRELDIYYTLKSEHQIPAIFNISEYTIPLN